MAIHKDKVIDGPVDLDGSTFENVQFKGAQLFYSGGVPPQFTNCGFDGSTVEFRGQALNTLSFIKSMAPSDTGLRPIVDGLIPELAL